MQAVSQSIQFRVTKHPVSSVHTKQDTVQGISTLFSHQNAYAADTSLTRLHRRTEVCLEANSICKLLPKKHQVPSDRIPSQFCSYEANRILCKDFPHTSLMMPMQQILLHSSLRQLLRVITAEADESIRCANRSQSTPQHQREQLQNSSSRLFTLKLRASN